MSEILHAWIRNEYIGYFEKWAPNELVRFYYEESSRQTISLSLPRDVTPAKRAAQNFLDGLVPEDEGARAIMRSLTGARSTRPWDLLYAVEGDLPGGLLLHPNVNALERDESFVYRATESDIEARIASIQHGGTGLGDRKSPPRFSLAGVQGKFALAEEAGTYYWPDAATPSTLIVKPARSEHAGLDEIEVVSLTLATALNITAAQAEVRQFGSVSAFTTARFDRVVVGGETQRLHVEDVAQSLGIPPEQKYSVGAQRTVALIKKHAADPEHEPYKFIKQLAFNVNIGNADAHAKNYTLIHGAGGVALAPLYDAVPTIFYPQYEQRLGMRIGNQHSALSVAPNDWVYLAKKSGLDSDRVLSIVRQVSVGFLENAEGSLGETEQAKKHPQVFDALLKRAETTARQIQT